MHTNVSAEGPRRSRAGDAGPAQFVISTTPDRIAPVFERFHAFKEFMLLQKDTLEPERALELYEQYKYDFKVHTSRVIFNQNMGIGYVKSRYGIDSLCYAMKEKMKLIGDRANEFILSYKDRRFGAVRLEAVLDDPKSANLIVQRNADVQGRIIGALESSEHIRTPGWDGQNLCNEPFFGNNPNARDATIILKKLPGTLQTQDILDTCNDLEGLVNVTLLPSCILFDNVSKFLAADANSPEKLEQAITECYAKSKGGQGGQSLMPYQTAWLDFDSPENAAAAENALERRPLKSICTYKPLRMQAETRATKRIRLAAGGNSARREKDLKQCAALICKLDREFQTFGKVWPSAASGMDDSATMSDGAIAPLTKADPAGDDAEKKEEEEALARDVPVEGLSVNDAEENKRHPFLSCITFESDLTRLDLMILYLRNVHFLDFYGGKIFWSEREMFEVCGPATLRLSFGDEESAEENASSLLTFSAHDEATFNRRFMALLALNFELILKPIGEGHAIFEKRWSDFCKEHTQTDAPEKYRCGICRKLFKGAEFVRKHLRNKHSNEIQPIEEDVKLDMMKAHFEADEYKLLLFLASAGSDDVKTFQSMRAPQFRASEVGPHRRLRISGGSRADPMRGQPDSATNSRNYRDWDAPKSRLATKAAGGNFRAMLRYDDL